MKIRINRCREVVSHGGATVNKFFPGPMLAPLDALFLVRFLAQLCDSEA